MFSEVSDMKPVKIKKVLSLFSLSLQFRDKDAMGSTGSVYSGLGYSSTRYLQIQVLRTDNFTMGLSPSSLWTRSLPVVVVVVSGSRWVLRCMGE